MSLVNLWLMPLLNSLRLKNEFPTTFHYGKSDARYLPHHVHGSASGVPCQTTQHEAPKKLTTFWTQEQQAKARADRWELVDTVDAGTNKPVLRIFGVDGLKNVEAQARVMNLARAGHSLHIEALRAIAQSFAKPKGKT